MRRLQGPLWLQLADGAECMGEGVQLVLDPLQRAPDGVGTVQHVDGQRIWVELHGEGALDAGSVVPREGRAYGPSVTWWGLRGHWGDREERASLGQSLRPLSSVQGESSLRPTNWMRRWGWGVGLRPARRVGGRGGVGLSHSGLCWTPVPPHPSRSPFQVCSCPYYPLPVGSSPPHLLPLNTASGCETRPLRT